MSVESFYAPKSDTHTHPGSPVLEDRGRSICEFQASQDNIVRPHFKCMYVCMYACMRVCMYAFMYTQTDKTQYDFEPGSLVNSGWDWVEKTL